MEADPAQDAGPLPTQQPQQTEQLQQPTQNPQNLQQQPLPQPPQLQQLAPQLAPQLTQQLAQQLAPQSLPQVPAQPIYAPPAPEQPNDASGPGSAQSHPSFRRQRASRACETCHARKVRCDAASLGVPCTNCVAFSIECRIPAPKRKKGSTTHPSGPGSVPAKDSDSDKGDASDSKSQRSNSIGASTVPVATGGGPGFRPPAVYHTSEATPSSSITELQAKQQETDNSTYVNMLMKPRFTRAPITEAGRVAYLGESSNLTLLVHDHSGASDVVHYPLPENIRGSRARLTELDNVEIEILHQRGAFLLPPRDLCDELVHAYFQWVHPIVPVINRTRFMRSYHDLKNPPSLLLLQAVLLAGSRVCKNPKLMDASGSTTPAALTFYKRAKALYDANYEDDRVTIVQSLLLMGWYWEGPEDVTKNVFYWSRVATIVAQGSGMHRSVEGSQLSVTDKRLWKRIWWTLFTRDRSVAVALGRPVGINLEDSDVEMLNEDDFNEDEPDRPSEYPPDPLQMHFFMQYVKLCEIMGLVLSQQYSVATKGRQKNPLDLTHSDMALADWLQNCPTVICWNASRPNFWSGLLFSTYYTTLCLLHRAYMPPGTSRFGGADMAMYPSQTIAFQAANKISEIIDYMQSENQLRYCPAFIVYSLFSALIMHVYQLRSPIPSIQAVTQDNLQICMNGLKEVSKVWLVGKMVYALFESILGNKSYEERLRRAGQRHHKMQQSFVGLEQHAAQQHMQQQAQRQAQAAAANLAAQMQAQQAHAQQQAQQQAQQAHAQQHASFMQPAPPLTDFAKRKFDEMSIDFSVNTPQPQESYERSRPQTPSMAHAKIEPASGGVSAGMPPPSGASPSLRSMLDPTIGGSTPTPTQTQSTPAPPASGTMGAPPSRPQTRPHTPFNMTYSVPATPPDLYLVTRNSPTLSQSVWENFQPDQLFPDGTGISSMFPPTMSPGQAAGVTSIDAAMGGMGPAVTSPPPGAANPDLLSPGSAVPGASGAKANGGGGSKGKTESATTATTATTLPDGQSPDSWSTSSVNGQPVPATLNVEDWFQFFGLNTGDGANPMNIDLSSM